MMSSSCRDQCTSWRCRSLNRLLSRTLWWLQRSSLTYLFSECSLPSVSCSRLSCLQIVDSAVHFLSCWFSIVLHHLFFYVVLLHHYENDVCMMTFQMRCSRIWSSPCKDSHLSHTCQVVTLIDFTSVLRKVLSSLKYLSVSFLIQQKLSYYSLKCLPCCLTSHHSSHSWKCHLMNQS